MRLFLNIQLQAFKPQFQKEFLIKFHQSNGLMKEISNRQSSTMENCKDSSYDSNLLTDENFFNYRDTDSRKIRLFSSYSIPLDQINSDESKILEQNQKSQQERQLDYVYEFLVQDSHPNSGQMQYITSQHHGHGIIGQNERLTQVSQRQEQISDRYGVQSESHSNNSEQSSFKEPKRYKHKIKKTKKDKDSYFKNFFQVLFKLIGKLLQKQIFKGVKHCKCFNQIPELYQNLRRNQNQTIRKIINNEIKSGTRHDLFNILLKCDELKIILLELFCSKRLQKLMIMNGRMTLQNRKAFLKKFNQLKRQIVKINQKGAL